LIVDEARSGTIKVGMESKRKGAGWNERYLLKVLNGRDALALGEGQRYLDNQLPA